MNICGEDGATSLLPDKLRGDPEDRHGLPFADNIAPKLIFEQHNDGSAVKKRAANRIGRNS